MHLSLVPDDHRPGNDRSNDLDADPAGLSEQDHNQDPRGLGRAIYDTATAAIQHGLNDDHRARRLSQDVLDSQLVALDQLDDHACRDALHGLLTGLFNDVDWPYPDDANTWSANPWRTPANQFASDDHQTVVPPLQPADNTDTTH